MKSEFISLRREHLEQIINSLEKATNNPVEMLMSNPPKLAISYFTANLLKNLIDQADSKI